MDPMVWELFVVAEPADEKLREADGGLTPIKKGFCGSDMPHILLGDFCCWKEKVVSDKTMTRHSSD